ncbi:MAG: HAMP domain-containing histidine kinase [Tannerellaceae bacterium]|jgi:signal transduction histidine kinase|nr:HAMP domain-containing histidine kinase [Tannerellaceae bacterium]
MKLIDHLILRISIAFTIVIAFWSAIYFFLQMKEINDGNDEGLTNLKQEFIAKANSIAGFVENLEKYNPLNIIIQEIPQAEAEGIVENFATARVYFATELEKEEVRMLTTSFRCEQNGKYYRLQFFTSTVESDDLIKNMLYLLAGLWITISLTAFIVGKRIIAGANRPFYRLLDELKKFRLDNRSMIDLEETNIKEYRQLNESVKKLLEKNIRIFTEQKIFIENTSHELQTPLAIVIAKLEMLLEKYRDDAYHTEETVRILHILGRMKRLNSNLLLLSKIRNNQFLHTSPVNLREVSEAVLAEFEDLIAYKEITLEKEGTASPICRMNEDLAHILLTNLIKNAVAHNRQNGEIIIRYASDRMVIANSGNEAARHVFDRYQHDVSSEKSSGLGLSIVQSIAGLYRMEITYHYGEMHVFTLKIP